MQVNSNTPPNLQESAPRSGFLASFSAHPASVDETYFGHMKFALRFSMRLLAAGAAAFIHGFVPAWFETTASRQIKAMHSDMVSRNHSPES